MENPNGRSGKKMRSRSITASFLEPYLLQNFVEQLADLHFEVEYNKETAHQGWQTITSSTVEAHVNVGVNFSKRPDGMNMSYVTIFLFTCVRENGSSFKLSWSNSLS